MYWDSFFRQLDRETSQNKDNHLLCTCREQGRGGLIHDPGKKIRFIGQCSPEKACFKIRFDSKRVLSRKLQIVSKAKTIKNQKAKSSRLTLDAFLGLSYTLRETNKDIPRPPPPQSVARPKDS
jgi:hypothetical protein